MTVTLLFNLGDYTTRDLATFQLFGFNDNSNGFRSLTSYWIDVEGNTSAFNIFKTGGVPKIKYKQTVYDFQENVTPSLESGSITNSLIVKSDDGNPVALRLESANTGEPRVIFSGSPSAISNPAAPKVAYLSDAFSVYDEVTNSSAYAGTFIFPLPNLDNVIDFDIFGGYDVDDFRCNLMLSTGNVLSVTITPKVTPVIDGSFTFSKNLTINYNDGTPALVYDVTNNFQLFFSQLSALTPVNSLEYTYDITNAVSASELNGTFDGVRLQLYTSDDTITINGSSWSATPYDAVIDFDSITRRTPARLMSTVNGRITEFDDMNAHFMEKKKEQILLENMRRRK